MLIKGKKILLGVTGGIAAYKSAFLIRLLREAGAEVQVVMTKAAQSFITPMTLQCLSERPVRDSLFDCADEHGMGHIALSRWCDAIVIAPAVAGSIARIAQGFADDLLSTLCLASTAPILIAPAMNKHMWDHPATQDNVNKLRQRGVRILGPESGLQACGDVGEGRMLAPEGIMQALQSFFTTQNVLKGLRVLITAGPTYEAVDPVRFLGNRSSGKMGYALAEAWQHAGAQVTLVSGPTALPSPRGVTRICVESALEMAEAVHERVAECELFIGAAAVADYQVNDPSSIKLKKNNDMLLLKLRPNRDIIAEVAALSTKPYVVGFAAETNNVVAYAQDKLKRKHLDMIVANEVGPGKGFGQDQIALTVITADGKSHAMPMNSKHDQAKYLVQRIMAEMKIEKPMLESALV